MLEFSPSFGDFLYGIIGDVERHWIKGNKLSEPLRSIYLNKNVQFIFGCNYFRFC